MNTDVEDLLREGMERFTANLRAPAGLTSRIVRRRRRRLALGSMAGAVASLTAGAVALLTVVMPGASAMTTAYVMKRVDRALSAAEPGAIAQMTVTTRVSAAVGDTVTTTAEEWSYGESWRSVTNSSSGSPLYDEGFSTASGYTLVSYPTRTWARQQHAGENADLQQLLPGLGRAMVPLSGRRGCELLLRDGFRKLTVPHSPVAAGPLLFQPGLPGVAFSASSLPTASALRTAISCGTLAVVGRQRVDGIEAIELASRSISRISETIWVKPGTYLPVRVAVRSAPGTPGLQQTADITWLPPTAQDLAMLAVPIPPGFRHVRLTQAVLPILKSAAVGASGENKIVICFGPGPAGPACHGPIVFGFSPEQAGYS
jgi:hypothetical protein